MKITCATCGKPAKIRRFGKSFCHPHCAAAYVPKDKNDDKSAYRLVENLSHKQREATPPEFADYLVWKLRRLTGFRNLAALWVRHDSIYRDISGVDCWDLSRNAYLYTGPYPVICHPPCGPHGRYKAVSRQDKYAGPFALSLAQIWLGVVEQPASSQLFTGGELVAQGAYGHPAEKLTRLLWFT